MTAAREFRRAAVLVLATLTLLLAGSTASAGASLLTLESPGAESVTNDPSPPFEGSTVDILDPVTVTLYTGASAGGSPVQSTAAVFPTFLGHWEAALGESLSDGEYTAVASQPNGEEELRSSPVTFIVDTLAPSVSLNSLSSPSDDATPSFSGGAGTAIGDSANVTLRVYQGSSVGGPIAEESDVARSGSSWSHTAETLPDGTYTSQAVQEDAAGNLGKSQAVTFTIDTQAPNVSIDSVTTPTSDSTPTFTGSAGTLSGDHASVAVAIRHEGTIVAGSASVSVSSGKWSFTPSALPDGNYTLGVLQEDTAGNTGLAGPVSFTVDTHVPGVSISSPASPTNDPTPTLSGGAGALSGDSSLVTVVIRKGSLAGEVVQSAEVTRSGSSWSYTTAPLADGTYVAQALQEDETGAKGTSSAVSFTVDTQAPIVSIAKPASPSKDSTPTLSGVAGSLPGDHTSVTVTIHEGNALISEAKGVGVVGGKWSYTPAALADGAYTAEVSQSDTAGNSGSDGPVGFTIDTHTPAVSIEALASPINISTPTLIGGAGSLPGDGLGVLVVVHKDSISGAVIESTSVQRTGAGWSHTTAPLADGTYVAQALQEDEAGARGESAPVTFVVDTQTPIVSIDHFITPIKDSTPSFTGHAGALPTDHPSVTVVISQGGSVINEAKSVSVTSGKWGYTAPSLADGDYTVQVSQRDTAGNVGVTEPIAFAVDTNAPKPSINPMTAPINSATPTLTGSAGERSLDEKTVRVAIYAGTSVAGAQPVAESTTVPVTGASWSYTAPPLSNGTYTALVEQRDGASERGSSALIFVIDTTAPHVTLTEPANGTILTIAQPTFGGAAGVEAGDHPAVSLKIYTGTAATGTPLQTLQITASNGQWSSGSSVAPLPEGFYTASAEQSDDAGNDGMSTTTFAIKVPPSAPTPTAPSASFRWFPTSPRVGEPVSLVSTSSAGSSPLAAYAWSVNGALALTPGPAVLSTSFSTPGAHLVRLQVTASDGLSAATEQTITVTKAAAILMQPFPVVRIAGSGSARRIKISLFTVLAPTGARVTVSCHGRGCPAKTQSILARALHSRRRAATVLISFARFERSLGVGAVLEIKVSHKGQIGKYTRFTVRRGKLPARLDTCLSPDGIKPMNCPS